MSARKGCSAPTTPASGVTPAISTSTIQEAIVRLAYVSKLTFPKRPALGIMPGSLDAILPILNSCIRASTII
ncbi:hypothetical protein YTPLAS18_15730 [Nitrospira sp.]|nr:hypothetical protein YTPLAS18_15730 [Nitrospira sp.]